MNYLNSVLGNRYPKLVLCRKEFLAVLEKAWKGDPTSPNSGIDYPTARSMSSLDDLVSNCSVASCVTQIPSIAELCEPCLPFVNGDDELASIQSTASLTNYKEREGLDYLYGNVDHIPSFNPVGDQYKILVKGDKLFVGVEPGFLNTLEDKEAQRLFILNCLEMCRITMQGPALLASPLYRRFIFINVNV